MVPALLSCLFKFKSRVLRAQGFEHIANVAGHEAGQIVEGEADAVVGDAVLGEIVGADFLGAVAGANL